MWPGQGVIKPLFCVLEDELLSASDELLRETGQLHHMVRSHNELNVAKVASCVSMFLKTFSGSVARSANCRYLIYSEADFEVFRTDGGEIWQGGGDRMSPPPYQISPHRRNDKGVGPKYLTFYSDLTKMWNINDPLRDFHKICRTCTPFQVR